MTHVQWGSPSTVEAVVEAAHSVGAFPASAQRIREVVDDPEASLLDLERVVAADPAVTAVVLRVANSAFFGLKRSVVSVKEALLILGFSATKELALSIALVGGLRSRDPLGNRMWSTALRTGSAAHLVASHVPDLDRRAPFAAGLLHEIGALVLIKVFSRPYAAVVQRLYGQPGEWRQEERRLLGFDHPELAGACLGGWHIPEEISGPVRWHGVVAERPEEVPEQHRAMASVVHIARRLQAELATGRPARQTASLVAEDPVCRRLGLDALRLESAATHLPEEIARLVGV